MVDDSMTEELPLRICAFYECGEPVDPLSDAGGAPLAGRGLCTAHFARWKRYIHDCAMRVRRQAEIAAGSV